MINWRAALNFISIDLVENQSYCLCNYRGMKSAGFFYRSQVTIKTLSKFHDVTITEIPERFIEVSMQQTLTKNVLLYNFNEKISRGGICVKWVEM